MLGGNIGHYYFPISIFKSIDESSETPFYKFAVFKKLKMLGINSYYVIPYDESGEIYDK
jgi:hypothetical protein